MRGNGFGVGGDGRCGVGTNVHLAVATALEVVGGESVACFVDAAAGVECDYCARLFDAGDFAVVHVNVGAVWRATGAVVDCCVFQ